MTDSTAERLERDYPGDVPEIPAALLAALVNPND